MRKHTHDAFAELRQAYPTWLERFQGTDDIESWGRLVEEIDPEKLGPAIRFLVRTSKFPPTVADIFEAAGVRIERPRPPIMEDDL